LRSNAKVGQSVAIIGAGGIGFDVAEYLLHHDDSNHDKTADEVNIDDFLHDWGVDKTNESRGGLLDGTTSSPKLHGRHITMLQRKKGKLGKGLGKTTGWIHRATLTKSNSVEFLGSVVYDKVDDNGFLHITINKGSPKEETRILEVDNIITCAGQEPLRYLEEEASNDPHLSRKVYTIGGAYAALALDANRAIDTGTRLALKINAAAVVPGSHKFEAGVGAEQKLFELLSKVMK